MSRYCKYCKTKLDCVSNRCPKCDHPEDYPDQDIYEEDEGEE